MATKSASFDEIRVMLLDPFVHETMLVTAAKSSSADVRALVASHPRLPIELVADLLLDESDLVRLLASESSAITGDLSPFVGAGWSIAAAEALVAAGVAPVEVEGLEALVLLAQLQMAPEQAFWKR